MAGIFEPPIGHILKDGPSFNPVTLICITSENRQTVRGLRPRWRRHPASGLLPGV